MNNRLLRILQEQEAFCEKVGDDTEIVAYECKANGDVSTVNSIKIEPVFNFTLQDVKVISISPIAHTFMKNVQNATGEDDKYFKTHLYLLDHSIITENDKYNIFNISGIIDGKKPNITTNDLILQVNVEKYQEILEAEINCTIIEINGSNYTLNCTGEKNILYDLQSAVSIINDDLLLVNFDENITSEVMFGSNWRRYNINDSNSINGGIIALIVIILLIALATVITLVLLRNKIFRKTENNAVESTVVKIQ